VRARKPAKPHQRRGRRQLKLLGEGLEFRGRVRKYDPSAGVDHRPRGLEDEVDRLFYLARVPGVVGLVAGYMDFLRVLVLRLGRKDVLGEVYQNGAGSAGRGYVEGLLDDPRRVLYVLDEVVVLGARPVMPTMSAS
jgi:hypothetical protein